MNLFINFKIKRVYVVGCRVMKFSSIDINNNVPSIEGPDNLTTLHAHTHGSNRSEMDMYGFDVRNLKMRIWPIYVYTF